MWPTLAPRGCALAKAGLGRGWRRVCRLSSPHTVKKTHLCLSRVIGSPRALRERKKTELVWQLHLEYLFGQLLRSRARPSCYRPVPAARGGGCSRLTSRSARPTCGVGSRRTPSASSCTARPVRCAPPRRRRRQRAAPQPRSTRGARERLGRRAHPLTHPPRRLSRARSPARQRRSTATTTTPTTCASSASLRATPRRAARRRRRRRPSPSS